MLEKGNLIDDVFTEDEMKVLYKFVDEGNRRKSYRAVFGEEGKSDATVYRWFRRADVQAKIVEIGHSLAVYDTVCDKALLQIITNQSAQDRDKIAAIKTWNDLRNRVHTTIKVESKLDLSKVSTDNLESVVQAIMKTKGNEGD